MKKLILLILIVLVSCSKRKLNYKYRITGTCKKVIKSGDCFNGYTTKSITINAICYTDSIYGKDDDSVWYFNSDGSKMVILKPYNIEKSK